MNLAQLKRKNSVSIYQCILSNITTISAISKETGISQLTVCELANEMVKREILDISKPRRNIKGRRIHYFSPSHKYFSIFIDVQKNFFTTIGITTSGEAIERFDYPLNYENKSCQEVLDEYVMPHIRNSSNYKYCTSIFMLGDTNNALTVDSDVIKSTKEDLIAYSLADKHKIKLFDFNGRYIMSLYSHIHYPKVPKELLLKAIPFDEIISFQGDLYFDAFDALQLVSKEKLEEII